MEKYKLLYLQRFLERKVGLDVESCISELEKLKEEAQKCYNDVESDEFCQMLLVDGCFIVEFIRELHAIYPREEDYFIDRNSTNYIFRDLMLLENQLPFFILDKLHDMTKRDDELALAILVDISLPLVFDFPGETIRTGIGTTRCYNIKHLLHLVHILLCHGNHKKKSENNDGQTGHMYMPNATELSEAGVSFEKVSVTTSPFDSIKFEKGKMKIPHFIVGDGTEIILRNLIAYEQQSVDVQPKCFSDFATFMDRLIESDKDVNLLRQKEIIGSWKGEDKEVANLFNKIVIGVVTHHLDFYYKEECRKAIEHCKNPWNKMKANLLRNYFSSPWVGDSTVAAIVLLILTFIQTILAFIGPVKK